MKFFNFTKFYIGEVCVFVHYVTILFYCILLLNENLLILYVLACMINTVKISLACLIIVTWLVYEWK